MVDVTRVANPSNATATGPSLRKVSTWHPPRGLRERRRSSRSLLLRSFDGLERFLDRQVRQLVGQGDRVVAGDLLHAMEREGRDRLEVVNARLYAPNLFWLLLNPQNLDDLRHIGALLARDLAVAYTKSAAKQGWRLAASVEAMLHADERVDVGQVEALAWSDDFVKTHVPEAPRIWLYATVGGERIAEGCLPAAAETYTIGTGAAADLRLDAPAAEVSPGRYYVSRRHATIRVSGGRYELHDGDGVSMASTNGTFHNGRRITRPIEVHAGSRFVLGPVGEKGEAVPGSVVLEAREA